MKIAFLILWTCFINVCHAQTNFIIFKDLDDDNKIDTFKIVKHQNNYVSFQYQLSSKKYTLKKSDSFEITADKFYVEKTKNGINLHINYMRSIYIYSIAFEPNKKDLVLINYAGEQFGNATNNGSGKSDYDMIKGNYTAQWYLYDKEKEKLVKLPKVKKKLSTKKYSVSVINALLIDKMIAIDNKTFEEQEKKYEKQIVN